MREAHLSDQRSIEALTARWGARYRWLLLLSVMVGTMASIMSSTIINVAIPEMSHAFHLGQERAQWVSSGFMVAMTVSMLTTPWLLARYGYRQVYAGSMIEKGLGNVGPPQFSRVRVVCPFVLSQIIFFWRRPTRSIFATMRSQG